MTDTEDTIVVFTARSPDRIIREGGSQAWVLNPVRARQCTWLVCTQNQHNADHEFSDATEPHGSAFLLGRISAIQKPTDGRGDDDDRWQIAISEYARINIPNAWEGRNPVRYTSLESLGISLDDIEFQPMPGATERTTHENQPAARESEPMLTITEAKKRLAVTFGVKPEAIEIVVRG